MTTKKTTSAARRKHTASVQQSSSYHRLDTLLHTMRCIAQYQDALCELSHQVKRSGELSPELNEELSEILDRIPAEEYVSDLEAARAAFLAPHNS